MTNVIKLMCFLPCALLLTLDARFGHNPYALCYALCDSGPIRLSH
jgi:hypothetical protein